MPSLTSAQKAQVVSQFVAATGANDKTALRFLKNANFKLDVAADASSKDKRRSSGKSSTSADDTTAAATPPANNFSLISLPPPANSASRRPEHPTPALAVREARLGPRPATATMPARRPRKKKGAEYATRSSPYPWLEMEMEPVVPSRQSPPRPRSSTQTDQDLDLQDQATDLTYFNSNSNGGGAAAASKEAALDKQFDELRDESQGDSENSIGVESTMAYLSDLGVNLENVEMFVALELVQAPSFSEITRSGFVEGWKAAGASATKSSQIQIFRSRLAQLQTDPAYFKKVYRHTFLACKEPDQRALSLENALVFWEMFFSPPSRPWKTANHDWLKLWKEFLGEKWTRSVNKDMWNQTLEFANKTMEDDTLGFWSEDGAWPGVIDDFVAWYRAKDAMDTDA